MVHRPRIVDSNSRRANRDALVPRHLPSETKPSGGIAIDGDRVPRLREHPDVAKAILLEGSDEDEIEAFVFLADLFTRHGAMKLWIKSVADQHWIAHAKGAQFRNVERFGREEEIPFRKRQPDRPGQIVPGGYIVGRVIDEQRIAYLAQFAKGGARNAGAVVDKYDIGLLGRDRLDKSVVLPVLIRWPSKLPAHARQ